ncbi:MAG: riboflavin synthase [Alphaproteobacteria bacterium]
MFTGIITDIGRVRAVKPGTDTRFEITTAYEPDGIDIGASIACSGPCLTVIDKGRDGGQGWFAVEASTETLSRTTLGAWRDGTALNLERALKVGDELGGGLVTGHIDAVATIVSATPVAGAGGGAGSVDFVFETPKALMPYIAVKGSVVLDGVSLTVNGVVDERFSVNLIPHSLQRTTFGAREAKDAVNLEIDLIARYVARSQGLA